MAFSRVLACVCTVYAQKMDESLSICKVRISGWVERRYSEALRTVPTALKFFTLHTYIPQSCARLSKVFRFFIFFCHFSSICTYSFLCILYVCRIALLYMVERIMVSLYFLDTHIRSVFISKTHNVVKECMLSNYPTLTYKIAFYSIKASVLNAFDSCMP